MNCEKCRWYRETFTQHVLSGKIYKGVCLLGGYDGLPICSLDTCDGLQYYEPKELDEVEK